MLCLVEFILRGKLVETLLLDVLFSVNFGKVAFDVIGDELGLTEVMSGFVVSVVGNFVGEDSVIVFVVEIGRVDCKGLTVDLIVVDVCGMEEETLVESVTMIVDELGGCVVPGNELGGVVDEDEVLGLTVDSIVVDDCGI